ncbi:MAG: sensor histidine kinase [Bacteroidota bacterium]
MFRSIRARLVLWYTGLVVVTFIIIAVVVVQNLDRTLSETLDQSLTAESKWMSERLNDLSDNKTNREEIRSDIFEHIAYYYIKEYVEIFDANGVSFFRSANLEKDTLRNLVDAPLPRDFILTSVSNFRNHGLRIAIRRTNDAAIYVAIPQTIVSLPLNHILEIFVWLGPIVVFISIGGGIYLANKSLLKVNRVIEAAKLLTADRLDDRLPEQEVPDEIGRLISTFNEMIARLDFSFKQMKQFSADASHELRTPLAVIRAQLEQALDDKASLSEVREIAANCLDEIMHMSILVDHLLLLAKADAHQEVVLKNPVQLGSLIRDLFDESVMLASPRSINVVLRQVEDVVILGDTQRLRQMILNLIDNAIKYNHVRGEIALSLMRDDRMAKILVSDTGIGIPATELPRIFDRFYRVDKARSKSYGGVGLGLSIVKWTVEAHGGRISVASELGKGTTFTIFMPVVQENDGSLS